MVNWRRIAISVAVAKGQWIAKRKQQRAKRKRREREIKAKEEIPEVEEPTSEEPYTVWMKVDYADRRHHELDYEVWVCINAESRDDALDKGLPILRQGATAYGLPIIDPVYGVEEGCNEPDYGELILRGRLRMIWDGRKWREVR